MIIQHLANLPSACPSDSSSLESCISVLKSSISALESSVKATEGSSGHWETVGWLCALAVAIGIAGEIVVIVSEHLEDLEDWGRGIIRPPDRPPAWRFWFDIVATLIVLGGVFGEAGATAKVSSINSLLRSNTSALRAKSGQLVAVITEEAGEAAQSAKTARDEADAATVSSKKAQARAAEAGASAKLAQSDASSAQQSAMQLFANELVLAAEVSGHVFRPVLFSRLKGSKPANVQVVCVQDSSTKTCMFSHSLSRALNGYGWHVSAGRWNDQPSPTTIYNKWMSLLPDESAAPEPFDDLTQLEEKDTEFLQGRLERSGASRFAAARLATLALALGARLVKQDDLAEDSLRITLADPNR